MNGRLSTILLVFSAVSGCYSYGTGAPIGACTNLAPNHYGITPQTSDTYSITANSTEWSKSGVLSVEISGGAVHGFILQARQKTDGAGIGMFDEASLPAGAQMGPCTLNSQKNSVTHTSTNLKDSTTFIWKAPTSGSYNGAIYFQGAVAVNKATIWTNVKSSDIAMATGSESITESTASDGATTQPVDTTTTNLATPVVNDDQTTSGSMRMWLSLMSLTLCSAIYMM